MSASDFFRTLQPLFEGKAASKKAVDNMKKTARAKEDEQRKNDPANVKESAADFFRKYSDIVESAEKKPMTYSIKRIRDRGADIESSGTLEELIEKFSYTLEKGASYQNEKGNKKINRKPTTIAGLISNINNAVNNAAANGYAGERYELVKTTALKENHWNMDDPEKDSEEDSEEYWSNMDYDADMMHDEEQEQDNEDEMNESTDDGEYSQKPIEAYGVRGMKSTPWRQKFKNGKAFAAWCEKNDGDIEVHGARELETMNESTSTLGRLLEKWDKETKVSPEKKGMFKGKTKAELEKMLASLKKSGPHKKDSPEYTKEKEINFALRAKNDWGKAK